MNKIIRMQEDIQRPAAREAQPQTETETLVQQYVPFMTNTLMDPTTRLLQEIRFLLIVLVVLKLVCILKKKQ